MKKFKVLFFSLLFSVSQVGAREIMYLGRSTKGLLLGDAFTTLATDEFSLFYNPALLARTNDVRFTILNPSVGITNALDDIDRFTNFPGEIGGIVERLLGFPIYVNVGAFPFVKMGPIGFSLIKNYTTSLVMRNAVHPALRWDYRLDSGFIFGAAFGFGKGASKSLWGPKIVRKRKKKRAAAAGGGRTSFGFALKHINRAGLSGDFDVFGTTFFGAVNSGASTLTDYRNALGYSRGKGWGFDAGVDYAYSWGGNQFAAGLSIMDIGDTRFKRYEGSYDIPVQEMMINSGVSFSQNYGVFDYTLSVDMHPLNKPIDTLRKLHIGLELAIPFIRLYTGWNAGYLSYGTEFDLWIFSFLVGMQGVEVGANYKQEEGKRFIVYASLFDFNFSP